MDHAAATPVCAPALRAYTKAAALYGNPSALHHEGVAAAESLAHSRAQIAALLEVKPSDIRFVSGDTEANNIALLGTLRALKATGEPIHVVTTAIEHASVLEPLRVAEKEWGISVTYLRPNEHGIIKPQTLHEALTPHTRLVSIGMANNEIGVIQPIKALVATAKSYNPGIVVHTDAGQIHLHQSALPNSLGIDMLTMGSGKLYGPRGIGALYVRRGTVVQPIMFGGGHEDGLRSGTESVALAAGFGAACTEIANIRARETKRVHTLHTFLIHELKKLGGVIHGEKSERLPHIVNVSFAHIDPEYVVAYLDARGVALATKSACSQRAGEKASHVIAALCSDENRWHAYTALRISMGRSTKKSDVIQLLTLLPRALAAGAIR
jgi:cysteine desulfurase